jgi:hypothetical protein
MSDLGPTYWSYFYYKKNEKKNNQYCESILLEGQVKVELNLAKDLDLPFNKFI